MTERWTCLNRTVDVGGNGIPRNPQICNYYDCPEHYEIPVDQEPEPLQRCRQGVNGSLKVEKYKCIWEALRAKNL
jgi:hypothetical protein